MTRFSSHEGLALFRTSLLSWAILAMALSAPAGEPRKLRIGIIGCDTSHAAAFTQIINHPDAAKNDPNLAGLEVVAAFPGGSADLPVSADRVEKFTAQLRDQYKLEIVDSIDALLPKVDAILLLSVDGRVHWKQAEPVLKAKKPVYIDKPFAVSLVDAMNIVNAAKETKTPVFSCSSLRYGKKIEGIKKDEKIGAILGCVTYGPCTYAPHHPDLAFYGVHGLELLYAFMGPGCRTVTRTHTEDCDILTGTWADGRVATYRGTRRGKGDFGATVFGKAGIVSTAPYDGYAPMLGEVGKFFRTGVSPVSAEEMLEVIAVIEAAQLSKDRGGVPVALAEVYKTAESKLTP